MLTATDAPTPRSEPSAATAPRGVALATLVVTLAALRLRSPPPSVTVAPSRTTASFFNSAMVTPTEPATPVSPPLAPDLASARKWEVASISFCSLPLPSSSSIALPANASSRVAASSARLPSRRMT